MTVVLSTSGISEDGRHLQKMAAENCQYPPISMKIDKKGFSDLLKRILATGAGVKFGTARNSNVGFYFFNVLLVLSCPGDFLGD